MKKFLLYILAGYSMFLAACYKDLGNYDYNLPEVPQVTTLDSVYSVFVGDSLIIDPGVTMKQGTGHLKFDWKIAVPERLSEERYTGRQLRTIFGLGPIRYFARLTISDTLIGMKYFHDFAIDGKTAFSQGMVVLSDENSISRLSFIKPDGSVQARLYEAMHGEQLPAEPKQLIAVRQAYNPGVVKSYWIFTGQGNDPGLQLDANTMQRKMYLSGNFFDPPSTLSVGTMETNFFGVVTGVINNKLYAGTTSTWDQNPLYGMFGLETPGDYELSEKFIFNFSMATFSGFYIGYDKIRKQILRFNLYGVPTYFGTDYSVMGDAFDPKNMQMDLLHIEQINGEDVFAFLRDEAGKIYECKFSANFNGPFMVTPIHKREFIGQDLFSSMPKIAATPTGVFFFTKGDKIFRYNPLNEELRELSTSFGGAAVSMIKLHPNGNELIAGSAGKLYFLDISTGKNGEVLNTIEGIPGNPVDLVIRN